MKVRNQRPPEKVEVPMTPMIDVVFQLLVFFIMSFKIVSPEGDFNIKMPIAAPSEGTPEEELLPPIKVYLSADANGNLAGIRMNESSVDSYEDLRAQVMRMVSGAGAQKSDFECEFNVDYDLHYDNIIKAVTAVSGQRNSAGGIDRLIEKIKFAPPKEPG